MNSMKTKLLLGVCSCSLVLAAETAWASRATVSSATPMPLIQEPQAPPAQAQPGQSMPNADASKSTTFTGTVMKNGEQYVLRDSSGNTYRLDDSPRAQAFEGKTVKVWGRLGADSKTILVDKIQAFNSERSN
jgi:hypothetical protein